MAKGKLTNEQWEKIIELFKAGERVAKLAKEYGITRQAIYAHKRSGIGTVENAGK
jgi:DNA invertase Pin-like site-specific DNA recombinase